jgi:hypothetical protein
MPLHIPKFWASATGSARNPRDEDVALKCFGYSDSGVTEARAQAMQTLARLRERVRAGAAWPDRYGYGNRPIREEILRELHSPGGALDGYLTRNGYGATVLNSATLLFADIDDLPVGLFDRLRGLFRSRPKVAEDPHGLPPSILAFAAAHPSWMLRVYRTFAGWRVLAVHDVFDPESESTIAALREMGSDPQYVQLTKVQRCFRARLSPKPWRCGIERSPRAFPREDPALEHAHQQWLQSYVSASEPFATCRFITELGRGRPCADAERLILVHDEATRADRSLPLA